jgi:hypothetical protein
MNYWKPYENIRKINGSSIIVHSNAKFKLFMSKSYNVRAKCKEMFQKINVNSKRTFPWKFFELVLISSTFLDQPLRQVKYLEKLCCVCGRHLISINFPTRNWEGYYAYSLRMERTLCLLIGVKPSHYWRISIKALPFIHLVI